MTTLCAIAARFKRACTSSGGHCEHGLTPRELNDHFVSITRTIARIDKHPTRRSSTHDQHRSKTG